MPSLKSLRNRINSVKSTRKITQAMKMVAAAKLRRAQSRAEAARPYAERMERMLASLGAAVAGQPDAPRLLVGTGSDQVHLLVVVSGDRGLAGPFNTNIGRFARLRIRELEAQGKTVKLLTLGRKGAADDVGMHLAARWAAIEGVDSGLFQADHQRSAGRHRGLVFFPESLGVHAAPADAPGLDVVHAQAVVEQHLQLECAAGGPAGLRWGAAEIEGSGVEHGFPVVHKKENPHGVGRRAVESGKHPRGRLADSPRGRGGVRGMDSPRAHAADGAGPRRYAARAAAPGLACRS